MNFDRQYNEIYSQLQDETQLDYEINEKSKVLASRLLINSRTRIQIKGKNYTVAYTKNVTSIRIILIDELRLSIANDKYTPACFDLVLDQELSEYENLYKLIQTMYYYKYEKINVEDLGEDDGDEF